jgi:hypothetical protein
LLNGTVVDGCWLVDGSSFVAVNLISPLDDTSLTKFENHRMTKRPLWEDEALMMRAA